MLQKILVVDDQAYLLSMIVEALQLAGDYDVEQASNGKEAIDKYKDFQPDLVVMDIEMPVMDGYESSSKIKSFDPSARILVLTGNPGDFRARKSLEEGLALTLLKKPIKLLDLNKIVKESLCAHA